jgi:hypothetical protein
VWSAERRACGLVEIARSTARRQLAESKPNQVPDGAGDETDSDGFVERMNPRRVEKVGLERRSLVPEGPRSGRAAEHPPLNSCCRTWPGYHPATRACSECGVVPR